MLGRLVGKKRECRATVEGAEDGTQCSMLLAERIGIALAALSGLAGGMPDLVRERALLREQEGSEEKKTPEAGQHGYLVGTASTMR